jgi:predicted HicB family RNase H-like nuclease
MSAKNEVSKPVIVPERIHRALKIKATQEGKKLNELATELLSAALKMQQA